MRTTARKTRSSEAVAYYRTSTDDQLLGIDAQHTTAARIAEHKRLTIVREWTEHESGGNNERPELDQALHHAKRTGATLIVAKLDRLARDSQFLMRLYDSGALIVFGDLPEVDGSAASRLMIQMMANFAEFERRRIGERTKEALAVLKARGVPLGATRPQCRSLTDESRSLGAKISGKARTARAVDDMRDVADIAVSLREAGETLRMIADHLEKERIPSRHGLPAWTPTMVKRVIDRARAKS
jgi:DNA invertase Pin-like site-specific DNA recombinase